jgi:hypothetical protein
MFVRDHPKIPQHNKYIMEKSSIPTRNTHFFETILKKVNKKFNQDAQFQQIFMLNYSNVHLLHWLSTI